MMLHFVVHRAYVVIHVVDILLIGSIYSEHAIK